MIILLIGIGACIQKILNRIPPAYVQWIQCEEGWFPILCDLDAALALIEPDYVVLQVKEKLGGLRYYVEHPTDEINALIRTAETRAAVTCEACGKPGKLRLIRKYLSKTVCDVCGARRKRVSKHQ